MRLNSVSSNSDKELDVEYHPTAVDIVRMIQLGDEAAIIHNNQRALEMDFQAQLAVNLFGLKSYNY